YYELRRETLRLRQDWQQASREMVVLSEIGNALIAGSSIATVLDHMVKAVCTNFSYQCCTIDLIEKNSWELCVKACYGCPEEIRQRRLCIEDENVISYVARTGKPAYLPDVSKDSRYLAENPNTRSQLVIPLRLGEEIIGVFNI